MRFMMIVIPKDYATTPPDAMPDDAKAVGAMMKYNDSLQKAGILLALDGLHPPAAGVRVSFADGKPVVKDGPFTESKESVGGYWIIQVKSKEEAVEWAKRCPMVYGETIEIRQLQEISDFPPDVQEVVTAYPEITAKW